MLWRQGAQDIGLSTHKLKSATCTPVPDRQMGRTSW